MALEDNIYLISGNDQSAINKKAREIIQKVAGENADAFGLDVIKEGDDFSSLDVVRQAINSILSPPLMGGRKTVWMREFSAFPQAKKSAAEGTVGGALNRLTEIIEKGIPDDICLVMDGPGLDRRKSLYKVCEKSGTVEILEKVDQRDRKWQGKVSELIRRQAEEKGLKLSRPVLSYLISAIGTDTARIDNELEKLVNFYDGEDVVTPDLADVRDLCAVEGETVPWALWDAVGMRDVDQALRMLAALLHNENDPDKAVLGVSLQTAGFIRNLLQVKILMAKEKIRNAEGVQNFLKRADAGRKEGYVNDGVEIVNAHPYRARMLAEQAVKFKGQELVQALVKLKNVCRTCVTSDGSNRAAFEHALVEICG
ncbi:MAG: DNA polymerase III subunit delta [Lentisphaeria bacterium]